MKLNPDISVQFCAELSSFDCTWHHFFHPCRTTEESLLVAAYQKSYCSRGEKNQNMLIISLVLPLFPLAQPGIRKLLYKLTHWKPNYIANQFISDLFDFIHLNLKHLTLAPSAHQDSFAVLPVHICPSSIFCLFHILLKSLCKYLFLSWLVLSSFGCVCIPGLITLT